LHQILQPLKIVRVEIETALEETRVREWIVDHPDIPIIAVRISAWGTGSTNCSISPANVSLFSMIGGAPRRRVLVAKSSTLMP
jgi:hypothetical protein